MWRGQGPLVTAGQFFTSYSTNTRAQNIGSSRIPSGLRRDGTFTYESRSNVSKGMKYGKERPEVEMSSKPLTIDDELEDQQRVVFLQR